MAGTSSLGQVQAREGVGGVRHRGGVHGVKGVGVAAVAGQTLKGDRGDDLLGVGGEDGFHLEAALDQPGAEIGNFISSNTAGNAQQYVSFFGHEDGTPFVGNKCTQYTYSIISFFVKKTRIIYIDTSR